LTIFAHWPFKECLGRLTFYQYDAIFPFALGLMGREKQTHKVKCSNCGNPKPILTLGSVSLGEVKEYNQRVTKPLIKIIQSFEIK
jgi:hypothetical protein